VGCYGQINEEIEEERAPWFTKRDQDGAVPRDPETTHGGFDFSNDLRESIVNDRRRF
jgi:hypothetical protein